MKPSQKKSKRPLEGVRVLEMGTLLAGPFCAHLLADFGAEVIKIEPPGRGDPMRGWGSQYKGQSLWWQMLSRNKKCITLNLKEAKGQEIFCELVKKSDIGVENFRPGTLERWNLGYDRLKSVNERFILVRVSGYGQTGPYKDRAGFGSVAEAFGGLRYTTGYPDRPPTRVGISLGDSLAGTFGAIGALMALYHRDIGNGGSGQVVDIGIYEAVFKMMESIIPDYKHLGRVRERTGSVLPGVAPSNIYPTQDKKYVVIAANADSVFSRLTECMGRPELAKDPDFATHEARGAHMEDLDKIISEWTPEWDSKELIELLAKAGVPAGPICSAADIIEDPHYWAREMLLSFADPKLGEMIIPGIVPKLSETPGGVSWLGPALGEHNQEIYQDLLDFDDQHYNSLAAEDIV
jgi:succinyl-CoA--D-citramalate CoA-transferase